MRLDADAAMGVDLLRPKHAHYIMPLEFGALASQPGRHEPEYLPRPVKAMKTRLIATVLVVLAFLSPLTR